MSDINPMNNRWAALGVVAVILFGVAALFGSDGEGVLSRAADYGAAPVTEAPPVASVAPVSEPAPVVEEEPAEDDFVLEEDGTTADDEGIVQVESEPSNDDGGMPVVVSAEEAEEQE